MAVDAEHHRDEPAVVEDEDVVRGVGLHRDHAAECVAARVAHFVADELVDPDATLAGVVERLPDEGRAAELLGAVAIGDALEADEPAALMRTRAGDDERAIAGMEHGSGGGALGSVGVHGHDDLATDAVRATDPTELEVSRAQGAVTPRRRRWP